MKDGRRVLQEVIRPERHMSGDQFARCGLIAFFRFMEERMTQRELDKAVAIATGESEREIHSRGFGIADPVEVHFDPESTSRRPLVIDWDELYPADPPRR
jgi:hypothetical protein